MTRQTGRGVARATLGSAVAVVATSLLWAVPAAATTASDSSVSDYGWWSQASVGGASTPAPPGSPKDTLYVEMSPAGPVAVSAVRFPAVAGRPATLTLHLGVHPVLTTAPQACPLTSAFTPVQGGAWASRPSYDCTRSVPGVMSADQKQVTFDLRPLVSANVVNVAVLATGTVDRMGFDSVSASQSVPLAALASPAPAAAPDRPAPAAGGASHHPPAPTVSVDPPGLPVTEPVPTVVVVAPEPALAPALSAEPAPAAVRLLSVAQNGPLDSSRRRLASGIGIGLLLTVLVYWADGFGGLALRTPRRAGADA